MSPCWSRMQTYDYLTDDQLSFIGTQVKARQDRPSWYHIVLTSLTALFVAGIWFFKIAPDEKSPNTMMVQPAAELLSSFVQPAADMSMLYRNVGFRVDVPDLKKLGVEFTTVGESNFGGQHAAVIQYQYGYSMFLLYSFSQAPQLFNDMRQVESGNHKFFVTSGGEVSVVAWKDRCSGYHAIAAKSTETQLLSLAESVASLA